MSNFTNNNKFTPFNNNSNIKQGIGGGSKYSQSELEEAKNATKGLGKLGGLGTGLGGSNHIKTDFTSGSSGGNYRKSFKPTFNGVGSGNNNNPSSTKNSVLSNTMNSNRTTLKNNVMQHENYLVEKNEKKPFMNNNPNLGGGIGNIGLGNSSGIGYSKPNFGMKQENQGQNSGRVGGNSYTNSKLQKQNQGSTGNTGSTNNYQMIGLSSKQNMNTLLNQHNDSKSKQDYKNNLMMKNLKQNQNNQYNTNEDKKENNNNNFNKTLYEEVVDNRIAMNTKR